MDFLLLYLFPIILFIPNSLSFLLVLWSCFNFCGIEGENFEFFMNNKEVNHIREKNKGNKIYCPFRFFIASIETSAVIIVTPRKAGIQESFTVSQRVG